MAGEYQTAVLGTSGLVCHWPFADAPASGVLDDVHTNNLNGTWTGTVTQGMASILPGDTGGGSALAAGGYATVGDNALLDVNAHTVCGWVMPNTLRANMYLFARLAQWSMQFNKPSYIVDLGGLAPQTHATPGELIVPNNVYFFASGYGGGFVRLWLNGVMYVEQATTGTLTAGSAVLDILHVVTTNTFRGRAQHFSLFNRLLTDTEIKDLALLGFRGPADPAGGAKVVPWSRQIVAANGSRASLRITNNSDNRIYLGLDTPAVAGAGKALLPFGDFWETVNYTGAVNALHPLVMGVKDVSVEET